MLRAAFLLVLLGFAFRAQAEDKKVTVRFLGGAKKVPVEGLKFTIRADTGDWSVDQKKFLTNGKTDTENSVDFTLADGRSCSDAISTS